VVRIPAESKVPRALCWVHSVPENRLDIVMNTENDWQVVLTFHNDASNPNPELFARILKAK
jgi:hypothetical protein